MTGKAVRVARADLGPGVDAIAYEDTGEMQVVVLRPDAGSEVVKRIGDLRRRA